MEQRDVLKDEIEQMGKALALLLSNFIRLKSAGKVSQAINLADEHLKATINTDTNQLLGRSKSELISDMKELPLTAEHLETLSDYLKEVGISYLETKAAHASRCFLKAICFIEIADEFSNAHSFNRIDKKNELNLLLQQCS